MGKEKEENLVLVFDWARALQTSVTVPLLADLATALHLNDVQLTSKAKATRAENFSKEKKN